MMEVLNAILVGSADADPLTYQVVSPHGLSMFSLVKAESARPMVAPTVLRLTHPRLPMKAQAAWAATW